MRSDGRSSDCRWPAGTPGNAVTARHLSADAEFAEDLAIRYADTCSRLGINLPFALLYWFACAAAWRIIWRRYPPATDGWIPAAVMAFFLSLVFATGAMMLRELWSWFVETYRIGRRVRGVLAGGDSNPASSHSVTALPATAGMCYLQFPLGIFVHWESGKGLHV